MPIITNKLKANIITLLINALGALPISFNQRLGWLLGHLLSVLPLRLCKITATNISHCLSHLNQHQQHLLLKQTLIANCQTFLEFPTFWHQNPQKLTAMIHAVHGKSEVDLALQQNKGLILLGPHLGAFELVNVYLSQHFDMVTLYRPPHKAYLEPLMIKARERLGTTMMPTNSRGVRALYKALVKDKRVIGILPDQDPGASGGEFVPFFGMKTWTMTLVSKLAQKSQAPVYYVYAKRSQQTGSFEIFFKKAPADIYDQEQHRSLAAMNKGIEQCVLECPSQYQWPYKRFKRQPEGMPAVYEW